MAKLAKEEIVQEDGERTRDLCVSELADARNYLRKLLKKKAKKQHNWSDEDEDDINAVEDEISQLINEYEQYE